jgi:hypothetical protein
MKDVFTNIVENRKWSTHICGPGSTMSYTEGLRSDLLPFLQKHNINSMLDIPCGDFSWMSTTGITEELEYIGADIVDSLITNTKKNYPGVDFRVLDLTKDDLPEVDLIFCRDCLLHLSFEDVDKAFDNIAKSNIKYILTSNWINADNIKDIATGSHRFLNFNKPPYSFDTGIDSIKDWVPGFAEREMILWNIDDILRRREYQRTVIK